MKHTLEWSQSLLGKPISMTGRILLLVGLLAIPVSFQFPLWKMAFQSNQYPDPLRLEIFLNHLEGHKTAQRDDLREINALNHYIGMRPLLESDFAEFVWLPFFLGFFGLFLLRAIVFGSLRDLVDVIVLYLYFGIFSAWAFYNRLYDYGHTLDPEAAIKVEPFTPPFFGKVKIANFYVESFPSGGTYALAVLGALLLVAGFLSVRAALRKSPPE